METPTNPNIPVTNIPVTNIPLMIFDLIFLPITVFRFGIIYLFGSRYNLQGFRFLDIMQHASNPYFNKNDKNIIETIEDDYRVVIRDDSRIYPLDIAKFLKVNKKHIIVGETLSQSHETDKDQYQDQDQDIIENIKKELNNIFGI
jgi:hypothetical protein